MLIRNEVVAMFAAGGPETGSPLRVVPDAGAVSTAAMAAFAREPGCDETAFVLPPEHPAATYRVRVFTPDGESPHGGHSCVGTAATLVRQGAVPAGRMVQECGGKLQELTATADRATLVTRESVAIRATDRAGLVAAAGLAAADVAAAPPGLAGSFAFLPVRTVAALDTARPDFPRMARSGPAALQVFAWDPGKRTAHARLFAPGFGIPEDPACAPIAMALGAWLVGAGLLTGAGVHEYRVRQGARGRQSLLWCTVTVADQRPVAGSVTGRVVPVGRRDPHPTTPA